MYNTHHDTDYRIAMRQEIVRQGIRAARHPGDLAAIREKIGRALISAGERVRGSEPRTMLPATPPRRMAQVAR